METVRLTLAGLARAAARDRLRRCTPFTLASYAIEGVRSRNYRHTKTLMYR